MFGVTLELFQCFIVGRKHIILRVTRHKYDCVIRSRYDLGADVDIDLNKLDLNKINISNHHWGGSPITDDNLCILNQDNAEKLFLIFLQNISNIPKRLDI